jgi:hypothetical protein
MLLILLAGFFIKGSAQQPSQGKEIRSLDPIISTLMLAQPAANLDQGKNEAFTGPISPMVWVNGNLNANQSHYIEGHSVAYRLVMTDMPVGTEVTLTMGFDLVNSSHYAIDFLTGYQQLQPHNFTTHNTEETVTPAAGGATSSMQITLPSYLDPSNDAIEGVANARDNFNTLPLDDQLMYLWGANFNAGYGVTYVYKDGNTVINAAQVLDLTRGETKVEWTIKFTPTSSTVTLGWGGHIAMRSDWGVTPIKTAGGISGSPYHMRTKDWSLGNLGNQDRSLQIALAGPICPGDLPTPLSLCYNTGTQANYPAGQCPSICAGGTLNFRVPTESSDPVNSTYAWSVTPSTGVTINPVAANTQQVAITFANAGVYTITVVITNNSGLQVTCTQNVTVNSVTCSITGNDNVCPNSQNQYSGPAGSTWAWSISGNGTISGPTNQQNVTVVAGPGCGPFTLTLVTTNNGCQATCNQQFSVTDTQAPVFTFCPPGSALGCNPTSFPEPGTPTATDNCGPVTFSSVLGDPVNTGGCTRSRTRTYTATDACGNTATCTQVFTYTIATTPVMANCGGTYNLGCNPATLPTCANYAGIQNAGAVTASNECGAVTVTCDAGQVTSQGCNRSQILTFTATSCGLTSTCIRTYNWQVVTAPVFANCGGTYNLGCNPATLPSCANTATLQNAGAVTASNECGAVTVTCDAGQVTSQGCNRSQILTFTATSCGLSST